jgi:hypothetical protein
MKKIITLILAGTLALGLSFAAVAQQKTAEKKPAAQVPAKKGSTTCEKGKGSCCSKESAKGKHSSCPMAEGK